MDDTPNLKLPYIIAAQAQKHVTHNEAIRALDALVQLSVLDRNLATPPPSPVEGARYIVAASATDAWLGHEGEVAAFQDEAWAFYIPVSGFVAWIIDESKLVAWDGAAWIDASSGGGGGGGSVNPTPLVGVNATADTTNRLSVSSPAALFNHEGSDHQLKVNKNAAGDTGSLIFQTGFSGRAEMGLAGDDDFSFKVSADGSTWFDAILIDRNTGAVSLPNTASSGGGATISRAVFVDQKANGTNGGTFSNGAWRTRDLNTTVHNGITGLTVSSNQLVFDGTTDNQGEYIITASCPAYDVNAHQAIIYNVTGSATVQAGERCYANTSNNVANTAHVVGHINVTAAVTLEIQHRSQNTKTSTGFGNGANTLGGAEPCIYSIVEIMKIS